MHDKTYIQMESVESMEKMESIDHKKIGIERHSRTRKEKPSTEAISSEGHY
jgi:hypothetical protein